MTDAIALAKKAKSRGWGLVVAPETAGGLGADAFAAQFAVGVRAGQFKAGGLKGAEHCAKYNELLRMGSAQNPPAYVGANYRVVE